ncbi:MAG TPA: protein translocase subunit SecF, partial [Telluria sp.]
MEFFRIKKDIPFMRHALIFNVISALTFVAAVFFLVTNKLHFSVEFTGGTVMELRYPAAAHPEKIRAELVKLGYEQPEVTGIGMATDVLLRLPVMKTAKGAATGPELVFSALCKAEGGEARSVEVVDAKGVKKTTSSCFNAANVQVLEQRKADYVGPQVGEELATHGAYALIMVVLLVMAYLAIRFEWKYAMAAIIANLHDVVIILGFFAFFQWEFSLAVLAGVLAVLG